jgi:predicted phosphoribosyltransferase
VTAAAALLRARRPRRLVLAVPVAPVEGLARVREAFDESVCLYTPEPYFAVGQWFVDFHQVSDAEVRQALGTTGP